MRVTPPKPPLTRWVWVMAAVKVAIHLWNHPAYGYFRDELYYIACSEHLAWGYVDHPPLSIAILSATRALFGDGMLAIRIPVILAGALTVVLTGMLTRELGGAAFAQALAALAFTIMPVMLVMATFFSMNAFDLLFWVAAAYLLVRLLARETIGLWIAFGCVIGVGLLNKYSIGFFAGTLTLGLLFTPARRVLLSPRLWLAVGLAALIFAPHVMWEIKTGLPTLDFMRNAAALKNVAMSIGDFIGAQILYTNPATVPIWLTGLAALLVAPAMREVRFFGIAYVLLLSFFIAQHGKPYYLAPIYPTLLAAGATVLERSSTRRSWRWIRPLLLALVIGLGLATLPLTVMLLGPEDFVRYAQAIGVEAPQEERHQRVELPQPFADRFGWDNQVATVARVYQSLSADEQRQVTIFTGNYGEAGAIDFLGPRLGLPKASSGHNSYWMWGPGNATGEIAIIFGVPRERITPLYEEITQADVIVSPYAMAYETNLPVFVCRRLRRPLAEVWPELRRFM